MRVVNAEGDFIPGLIIACLFLGVIYGWVKINPRIAPIAERSTWKARIRSLPEVAWILIVFLIVVGGIMQGFFTPTEAGSVGTFAVLVLTLIKRDMDLKRFVTAIWRMPQRRIPHSPA